MTGGIPFGFGFGPVPMPGPVDVDPRQMQFDEEQQRALAARLIGARMFHPANGAAAMEAPGDQGQDPGPGQSGGQGAPMQAQASEPLLARVMPIPNASPGDAAAFGRQAPYDPSDAPPMLRTAAPTAPSGSPDGGPAQGGPQFPANTVLASALGGMPSMTAGQMPSPQMPTPQAPQPQQAPAAQSPVDTLLFDRAGMGAPDNGFSGSSGTIAEPQSPVPARGVLSSVLPAPQATGSIPQPAPAPAGGEPSQPAPSAASAPPAPTPPAAALPPAPDAGMQPVSSFDPLTGQPVSGSPQPVRGEFDPLTGQPVSGAPQPAQTAGPQGAPSSAPTAAPGNPITGFLSGLSRPGVPEGLLAFGAGMLQGRSFGEGAGKGIQNLLAVRQSGAGGDVQRLETALKIQKAQQEQGALTANAQLIRRAFPDLTDAQALGGASNSNLVSAAIAKMQNPNAGRDIKTDAQGVSRYTDTGAKVFTDDDGSNDPKEVEIAGKKYWLKPGEKPSEDNLIGQAKDPQEMTAELRNYQALKNAGDPRTFPEYMRDKEQNKGPTVKSITLPDGSKVDREWDPNTRTWVAPNLGANAPAARDNSDVPPGVDPSTFRKESAKAAVAEQKADNQRAQQANMAMPILERAEKAYKALADAKAIGPYQASRLNRAIGGAMGADVEVQRQEYEAAAKELELTKAQIQMKGQGSVTENERAILRMTLPRLDAASPETGLNTLRGMREQFMKAASAGRGHAAAQQGSGQQQGAGPSQGGQQQAPQANAAASRYQQLRRGGMSQADAYARMQQEGY